MEKMILSLVAALTFFFSTTVFAIEWSSVNDKDSKVASCLDLHPPSESEMQDLLESQIKDPDARVNRVIRGIQFKNEIPEMLDLFEGLHRRPVYGAGLSTDLQATKCTTVMCAMRQYYGLKNALPILYIYAKFGLSTSPEAAEVQENYQNWKYEQLLDVLVALESLPPTVLPMKDRHLLHFLQGYSMASYGDQSAYVVANARVDVFDLWDGETKLSKIATLVHELGHVLGTNLDDTPEWKTMPKQFISQYAMTNPAEDFAESFLAYRMAPKKLQRVSPKRYDYIKKNVFKGLEFDSQKDCDAPFLEFAQKVESRSQSQRELILWTASHKNEITNEIRRQERMGSFVNQVRTTCGPQYLNEIQDPSSRDLSDKCLADVVKKRATLVSLRRDDHDDVPEIKIPLSSISDVTIARSKINLIRQELRNQYGQRLSRLYSSRNYSPGPHEKDLCPVIISNDDHTISEAEMLVLTKACEKKTTESFFKQLFEPDFYRILP